MYADPNFCTVDIYTWVNEHVWNTPVDWKNLFALWNVDFLVFPPQKANRYSEKSFCTEFVQFYISPKALRHNGVLLGQYPFCHLGLHPTRAAVEVLYFHVTVALNWLPTENQIPKHQLSGTPTAQTLGKKCRISVCGIFTSIALSLQIHLWCVDPNPQLLVHSPAVLRMQWVN